MPRDATGVLQNEYVTWTQADPHSKAYAVEQRPVAADGRAARSCQRPRSGTSASTVMPTTCPRPGAARSFSSPTASAARPATAAPGIGFPPTTTCRASRTTTTSPRASTRRTRPLRAPTLPVLPPRHGEPVRDAPDHGGRSPAADIRARHVYRAVAHSAAPAALSAWTTTTGAQERPRVTATPGRSACSPRRAAGST